MKSRRRIDQTGHQSTTAPRQAPTPTSHECIVRFADGTQEVRVVISATGYRSDYSWIEIPGVVDDRRVTPGLYFLGLSWQHTRGLRAKATRHPPG
jgi:hypothetical protein